MEMKVNQLSTSQNVTQLLLGHLGLNSIDVQRTEFVSRLVTGALAILLINILVISEFSFLPSRVSAIKGYSSKTRQAGLAVKRSPMINNTDLRSKYVAFIKEVVLKTDRAIESQDAEVLATLIVEESAQSGIDPLLIAAMIKAESTFDTESISNRGAKGLMQIIPSTGHYISKKQGLSWEGEDSLHEPRTNIKLGAAYVNYLSETFDGDSEAVLQAYNWGPRKVSQARNEKTKVPDAVKKYARTILNQQAKWRSQIETQIALATTLNDAAIIG